VSPDATVALVIITILLMAVGLLLLAAIQFPGRGGDAL
jgi:hypothetical protein